MACSWSCFVVRSPSCTAEGLHVLHKSHNPYTTAVEVKQATRVIGVALGTIHKGLEIARNVVVNGEFVSSETVTLLRAITPTHAGPICANSLAFECT
ncbi:unnamed protein product [Ectocarpus sp. CCAP 1310/34]|nr:unnamed protein product [Ectocarpus sp. CCAP 1310/34]